MANPQAEAPRENRGWSPPTLGVVVAIVVVAVTLRFGGLHTAPLDPDEVWEVTHASASPIAQVNRVEGFPPLHGLALGVILVATDWDGSARVFSAVCGLAAVGVAGLIGRHLGGPHYACWAAMMLALSPYHIALSRSARPYSFFVLLAAIAIVCAVRLRPGAGRRDWAAFLIASWATAATSYFGGLLIGLMITIVAATNGRQILRPLAGATALLALMGLPLAGCLWIDVSGIQTDFFHHTDFDFELYAHTYYELLTGAAVGPSVDELSNLPTADGIRAITPWAALVFTPAMVLVGSATRRAPRRLLLWTLAPLVAAPLLLALASLVLPAGYSIRYISWVAVPSALLLAAGAQRSTRSPLAATATLLMIAVHVLGAGNLIGNDRYRSYDFRALALSLEEAALQDAPLIAAPPYFAAAVEYHFGPRGRFANEGRPIIDAFPTTDLALTDEPQEWAAALGNQRQRLSFGGRAAIALQAVPDNDARSVVLNNFAEFLGAEPVGLPSPRIRLLSVRRGQVLDAIDEHHTP